MATLLLIRHGMTDVVGRRLVGRLPGVTLNEQGKKEAAALADKLAGLRLSAVYSSPMERALQTAEPIAARHGLSVLAREALNEVDFGAWSGRTFAELDEDPEFARFNRNRSGTQPPGGEHPATVQARVAAELVALRDAHPEQVVAVVSHADPLKAALCLYLGMGLESMLRFELSTASITTLLLTSDGVNLVRLNEGAF